MPLGCCQYNVTIPIALLHIDCKFNDVFLSIPFSKKSLIFHIYAYDVFTTSKLLIVLFFNFILQNVL